VLKRHCTARAKWRLEPGKPVAPLAPHYQLDCDFGARVIAIYKTGDTNDPIYLCDSHVAEVKPAAKKWLDIRLIECQSDDSNEPKLNDHRTPLPEVVEVKPSAPAPAETAPVAAAKKLGRTTAERSAKASARDLVFGDSAKALVDEAIWNLPVAEQSAIVHRKIGEYTNKIETVLSVSAAKIKVEDAIAKPFERAILEIIGNNSISDAQKDAALDQLGTLQELINHGLEREIAPLQAHRIAYVIAGRANWGASAPIAEELKPAYRAIYSCVRNAVRAAVPHAQSLDERLANLYAAKLDLADASGAKIEDPPERVSAPSFARAQ
jgi:hypothetical protein